MHAVADPTVQEQLECLCQLLGLQNVPSSIPDKAKVWLISHYELLYMIMEQGIHTEPVTKGDCFPGGTELSTKQSAPSC